MLIHAGDLISSFIEKDVGTLVGSKLIISHQWVLATAKANSVQGCFRRSTGSKSREVIVSLDTALSGEATRGALCPVFGSLVQEGHALTGGNLAKCHKDDEGTAASFIWGDADRAGTVRPVGERLGGILSMCVTTDGSE